jgi:RNA polymerase sigma-70 factor, ECF subfamily
MEETPVRTASAADEQELLTALRGGDAAAFETLVRLYGGRMLAVARRLVGSEEEARDVVQDAMLAAFRSMERFEGHARLSTWLHRITVNTALMKLRRRARKPEEPIEPLLPTFNEKGHHTVRVVPTDAADALFEREETRALVRQAIDELPDTYRTVLLLRDIEEMSTEEVASVLGVTTNAVKARLHRARQALGTLLGPLFRRDVV